MLKRTYVTLPFLGPSQVTTIREQHHTLLEKTALQNFTSEVNFIKGVPICKVTFVLTLQKVKVQRLPLQTLKYN